MTKSISSETSQPQKDRAVATQSESLLASSPIDRRDRLLRWARRQSARI